VRLPSSRRVCPETVWGRVSAPVTPAWVWPSRLAVERRFESVQPTSLTKAFYSVAHRMSTGPIADRRGRAGRFAGSAKMGGNVLARLRLRARRGICSSRRGRYQFQSPRSFIVAGRSTPPISTSRTSKTEATGSALGVVGRARVERDEQLAEERGEILALRFGEGGEQPLFVLKVRLDGAVDEGAPVVREHDESPAPISGVGLTANQSLRLQAVEELGHAAGGDHHRAAELASREGRLRAAQRGEDVEVGAGKAMLCEDAIELALDECRKPRMRPMTSIGAESRSGRSRRHCAVIRSTASLPSDTRRA